MEKQFQVQINAQNKVFTSQKEAIEYAKGLLEAGVYYMELKDKTEKAK